MPIVSTRVCTSKRYRERPVKRVVKVSFSHACKTCGESFVSRCSRSAFCSVKCKVRNDSAVRVRKEKIFCCELCGNEFVARADARARFCTRACATRATGTVLERMAKSQALV